MIVMFTKKDASRFVKTGFSWTIFFFGALALLWRAQWKLAIGFFLATNLLYLLVGFITLFITQEVGAAQFFGYIISSATAGYFGNRMSGRSYVKNGWTPDNNFPAEWSDGLPLAAAAR